MPAIRAVCIRLAEMVADQRHYLAPLPEPQESERRAVLTMVADKLRSREVTAGRRGSPEGPGGAGAAVHRLLGDRRFGPERVDHDRHPLPRECAAKLPAGERPDSYWADDVVAGIIASARALIGVDELHARTEARYSGPDEAGGPGRGALDRFHGLGFGAALLRLARRRISPDFLRRSATPLREQLEEACEHPDSCPQLGEIELLVG